MSEMIDVLQFHLTHLHLDQDFFQDQSSTGSSIVSADYDILSNKDVSDHYLMILRVSGTTPFMEEQGVPLSFEVTGVAEFKTPSPLTQKQKYALVAVNGGAILYGLIRGQLSLVSGSFPSGAILLPTIDWQEAAKKIERQKRLASKGTKKSPSVPDVTESAHPFQESQGAKRPTTQHRKTKKSLN